MATARASRQTSERRASRAADKTRGHTFAHMPHRDRTAGNKSTASAHGCDTYPCSVRWPLTFESQTCNKKQCPEACEGRGPRASTVVHIYSHVTGSHPAPPCARGFRLSNLHVRGHCIFLCVHYVRMYVCMQKTVPSTAFVV